MVQVKKRAPFCNANGPRDENAHRRAKEYRKTFRDLGLDKRVIGLQTAAKRVHKALK